MTTADAPQRQAKTTHRAVFLDRLNGVLGARRCESARAAGKGTERRLIGAHEQDPDTSCGCHRLSLCLYWGAQLVERGMKFCRHGIERRLRRFSADDCHKIERAACGDRQPPKDLAHPPLRAITDDGITDAA